MIPYYEELNDEEKCGHESDPYVVKTDICIRKKI